MTCSIFRLFSERKKKMARIYLISPPKINLKDFVPKLEEALQTGKVAVFQLRLKDISEADIILAAERLIKICHQFQVPFILNDRFDLALKVKADGVHLGENDGKIKEIRKKSPQNFIIGASCYDSKDAIIQAAEDGADYISLGAFFESKTKNSKGRPTLELLKWCDDFINVPTVCIGGITADNCQELVKNGADFLAIISYIWDHEKGVKFALNSFN